MHPVSRSLGGRESWNATQRRRDPLREEGPQGERSGPREQLTQTVLTTGWKTDQRGQWSQDQHARAYFRSPRRRWWWPGWRQWEQGSDQKGNSEIEAGGERRGPDHASNRLPFPASVGRGASAVSTSQVGILLRRNDSQYRWGWSCDTGVHIRIPSNFTFLPFVSHSFSAY